MRRKVFLASLLLVSFLYGCGKLSADEPEPATESEKEELAAETEASSGTETVAAETEASTGTEAVEMAETEEVSGEIEEGIFFYENSSLDFDYKYDYDYVCYVKGFYLSVDGESDLLYIQPIEWVWKSETERWIEWGNDPDDGPVYDYRDDNEEIISIPINDETEFHFYNDYDDPYLYEISDRYQGTECVTTDPKVFLYYWQRVKAWSATYDFYDPNRQDTPFFIILDEDGNVRYFIDHFWVG